MERVAPGLRERCLILRVWLGNRGVWEAIVGVGPTVAIPATEADVGRYVDAYRQFILAFTG